MRGLSVEDQSTEELVNTVTKFTGQVSQTMQQLEGSWKLSVPDLAVESMSVESALAQDNVLSNLERAVNEWMSTLTDALMQENTKEPDGKGPLAEIDFWRERAASLNGLCEQLESQRVMKMVELLEQSSDHANLVQQFKAQWSELTRLYLEAKDNVKFLATLERHFKNI
jgi:dynein heavy chain